MDHERTINAFHNRLFARHGRSRGSLGWQSRDWQMTRFEAVLSLASFQGWSVLDIGCGLGDLAGVLRAKAPESTYTGWDINPNFVEACRAERPDHTFELRNILTDPPARPFDAVVSVGPINIDIGDNERVMRAMIRAMFASCTHYCAMSMASRQAGGHARGFHYYDPMAVLAFCCELTDRVALRHDYLATDFCVYLKR
jgi:SAM-dependent methyltransferase